ncbi:unnamed protein product [Nezara viridula]|uniref:LIM zinc-binding domain-containing protein n=1 Tax=Nezara viridula TaxID=85310 RepID=A0A9P0DZI7_NEZVI|nr:unnamed protein product [Nezara viridula]
MARCHVRPYHHLPRSLSIPAGSLDYRWELTWLFSCRRCSRCGMGISSSELVMRARDEVFHLHCFSCTTCGVLLTKGDTFGMRGGALFCRPHYDPEEPPLSPAWGPRGRPRKRKLSSPEPQEHPLALTHPSVGQSFPSSEKMDGVEDSPKARRCDGGRDDTGHSHDYGDQLHVFARADSAWGPARDFNDLRCQRPVIHPQPPSSSGARSTSIVVLVGPCKGGVI